MPGLFQGLEIGRQALLGHQVTLQTIGHNIANVDTPGYTRQRVGIKSSYPEISQYGPIGGGLLVTDINHVRDLFLGQQYRDAQKDLGQWGYKNKALSQVESIFSEPQAGSLNEVLDQFWNDWSALSSDAENSGHRTSVVASATSLVNTISKLAGSLESLQSSTDRDLSGMTAEVNDITTEISKINQAIATQELDGSNANDLRDMRDHLVDELALIVDVNTLEKSNGALVVHMGSMLLVDGPDSFDIGVNEVRETGSLTHELVWKGSEVKLRNNNGAMAGLLQTRDEIIPRYLDELNKLARTIVQEVNSVHEAGYGLDGSTGVSFFDPNFTTASDIRLNREILLDKNMIAASDSANVDDRSNGQIAAALADLRNRAVMANDTATINQFYASLVSGLGVESREADSSRSNYELISRQIDNQRQSVQGVSLDEEMANLVKAQHAFDAASRVISVMDEALDTIISRMGVIG